MDGIALRYSDLVGNGPWKMPIQAAIAAGDFCDKELAAGHVIKIMTGAALLPGADTVVPVEEVIFESDFAIVKSMPRAGDFVRAAGDDIMKGQKLYAIGIVLRPVDMGVIASLGITGIKAIPKPKIALYSTGSEIIEPGSNIRQGQIYDSNYTVLKALLTRDGHSIPAGYKAIEDNPLGISEALRECSNKYDLTIISGGVSMGDYDFIPQEVKRIGEILLHKVAGNPVSVVAGYHLFARRVIFRLMGINYAPRSAMAILGHDLEIEGNRYCLVGARFEENGGGRIIAFPSQRQMSNRLSSIMGLDGFVFFEGGTRIVPQGSEVYIEWL
jgi:molybdopterin molybdotransferase